MLIIQIKKTTFDLQTIKPKTIMPGPGKVKVIIMDKAPNFNSLNMQTTLGFQPADYVTLATTFNQELGTQVTAADIDLFATVEELVAYMETL